MIDSDAPGNEELKDKLGVKGFPTIFLYTKNGKFLPYRGEDREAQTIWNEMRRNL
jgi:hypothetical protein